MKLIKPSVMLNNNWHVSRKFLIVLISVLCLTTMGSTNTKSQSNNQLLKEMLKDSNIVINNDTIKIIEKQDKVDTLITKSFKNIDQDLKNEIKEVKELEKELEKELKQIKKKEERFFVLNKNM